MTADRHARDDSDDTFWETHCWAGRFRGGTPCGELAAYRGPLSSRYAFSHAWRACAVHRVDGDVPMDPRA